MKRITVAFPERSGLHKIRLKATSPGWLLQRGQETDDVDDQAELEDILGQQEENSRQLLINSIIEKIGLRHPICYDVYDLCEYFRVLQEQKTVKV